MDKAQWKMVPVEPTPEMLAAGRSGVSYAQASWIADRYAAMLAAAPQPPSASGEREAFEEYGHSKRMAMRRHPHLASAYDNAWVDVAWEAWQARAALAPSPDIDAAEQKPVGVTFLCPSKNLDKTQCNFMRSDVPEGTKLYAAPPAAQPDAEWMAEAERLVDLYAESFNKPTDSGKCRQRLAALLAHLRTKPSTEPWCDTMDRPKSKCGCPDCGPSLIDLGPGLRNTPGKP